MKRGLHYVYKITNVANNKCYIGVAQHLLPRWYSHMAKSTSASLAADMKYFGVCSFTFQILAICKTKKSSLLQESRFIIDNKCYIPLGYNSYAGADRSADLRIKISDFIKSKNISIDHISMDSGISKTHIDMILSGNREITHRTRQKLNSALNTDF